jgi:CxxC motif-containing protein (DUF1111 family)
LIIPRLFYKYFSRAFSIALAATCLPLFAADSLIPSLDFITGKALFEKNWVSSFSSTTASDGLGPFYNARSCNQCHPDGGRGGREQSLVLHVNDPVYGQQLQKFAITGLQREAEVSLVFAYVNYDGKPSAPTIELKNLSRGAMANEALSARIAPSLQGLGLLARIPDDLILAMADEADSNGDGVSGRVNMISDNTGATSIGRFGWKAGQVSLRDQLARALSLDLGLGNPVFPSAAGDCTAAQTECLNAPHGNSSHHDNLETNNQVLDLLLSYVSGLPAPSKASLGGSQEAAGATLFRQSGCAACHVPFLESGDLRLTAYTDLLLHDMGPGLADDLSEGSALGSEWRTPPLWGLGSLQGQLLHDGRAATIEEAVWWHDGEGAAARDHYGNLSQQQRNDLNAFLNGL